MTYPVSQVLARQFFIDTAPTLDVETYADDMLEARSNGHIAVQMNDDNTLSMVVLPAGRAYVELLTREFNL
jgi:hypothetical protein